MKTHVEAVAVHASFFEHSKESKKIWIYDRRSFLGSLRGRESERFGFFWHINFIVAVGIVRGFRHKLSICW